MKQKRSVMTRKGDKGKTRLLSGKEVNKDHLALEVLGDIDELISFLGLARNYAKKRKIKKYIFGIQQALIALSADIAAQETKTTSLKTYLDEQMLTVLDQIGRDMESRISPIKSFIIPGDSLASSYLDCARAIARRCERRAVTLLRGKQTQRTLPIAWLNRLSDVLYVMARYEEQK